MMLEWKGYLYACAYWIIAAVSTHWVPWDVVLAVGVIAGVMGVSILYYGRPRKYPMPCGCCPEMIEDDLDLDWHGLGNCVDICPRCFGAGHIGVKGLAAKDPVV